MKAAHKAEYPAWQIERAGKLHRACLAVQAELQRGLGILKACRLVSRRYKGRAFKSVPARRTKLCAGTLHHLFKAWQRGGKKPDLFLIQFGHRWPAIPALPLVHFVEWCSSVPQENMELAWLAFNARPDSQAQGSGQISMQQVYYYFSATDFYRMQASLLAIETALNDLSQLREKAVASVRRRIPARASGKNGGIIPKGKL